MSSMTPANEQGSPLAALEVFEATDANVSKLERLLEDIECAISLGALTGFEKVAAYEECCRTYCRVLKGLPLIDGWRPVAEPVDIEPFLPCGIDDVQVDAVHLHAHLDRARVVCVRELRKYRFRLGDARRNLTETGLMDVIPHVEDLGTVARTKSRRALASALRWDRLDHEDFERLLYSLISDAPGYENPEWLMATHAPDLGRDLSVTRVYADALGGTQRSRVIIQCRHWLSRSVSVRDLAMLREQVRLWQPPRVDCCVVATSGRFTADAVRWIEAENQRDGAMRIEAWPETHLERLLAARPQLVAEFRLRGAMGRREEGSAEADGRLLTTRVGDGV